MRTVTPRMEQATLSAVEKIALLTAVNGTRRNRVEARAHLARLVGEDEAARRIAATPKVLR